MKSDVDERERLRRLDAEEVDWKSHLKAGEPDCRDFALDKGDTILIFDVLVNRCV